MICCGVGGGGVWPGGAPGIDGELADFGDAADEEAALIGEGDGAAGEALLRRLRGHAGGERRGRKRGDGDEAKRLKGTHRQQIRPPVALFRDAPDLPTAPDPECGQNAPMPHVEPLPTSALVAIAGLFATVVALWHRPRWVMLAALLVAAIAGFASGILSGPAGIWILGLATAVWNFRRTDAPSQRALTFVAAAVLAGLLAAHALSGFQNPVVLRGVVLSTGALPFTQYVNFDKTIAGVLVLAIGWFAPLRSVGDWRAALRSAAPVAGATIGVVMTASLALGFVRFDLRWTPLFWVWAPINLLLTCVSEEALFRGFLQRELGAALAGRAYAASIAVAVSALVFGLAHAAGGWRYVLLSTLAGTGYAVVYQRSGRVEMAILTHFAVNAAHFLLFTYPALA